MLNVHDVYEWEPLFNIMFVKFYHCLSIYWDGSVVYCLLFDMYPPHNVRRPEITHFILIRDSSDSNPRFDIATCGVVAHVTI